MGAVRNIRPGIMLVLPVTVTRGLENLYNYFPELWDELVEMDKKIMAKIQGRIYGYPIDGEIQKKKTAVSFI